MAAPSPQPPGNAAGLSALQPRLQGRRFPFFPHPNLRVREMLPKHTLLPYPAPVPKQGDPAQVGLVNPKDAQVGQHRIEGRGALLGSAGPARALKAQQNALQPAMGGNAGVPRRRLA